MDDKQIIILKAFEDELNKLSKNDNEKFKIYLRRTPEYLAAGGDTTKDVILQTGLPELGTTLAGLTGGALLAKRTRNPLYMLGGSVAGAAAGLPFHFKQLKKDREVMGKVIKNIKPDFTKEELDKAVRRFF
jgi:hypothetical protein